MANSNNPEVNSLAGLPKYGRRIAFREKYHSSAAQNRIFSEMVTIVFCCLIMLNFTAAKIVFLFRLLIPQRQFNAPKRFFGVLNFYLYVRY